MNAFTEVELGNDCEAQLLILGNNVAKDVLSIEDVGDYIPGNVMVQDLSIMTNTYMNKAGCDYLMRTREELFALGPEFFRLFFPPEEMIILEKELRQFIIQGDRNKVHSFFQRVRPDENHEYEWFLTTTRLYPSTNSADAIKLIHVAVKADMLSCVGKKLNNLVEDDVFVRKNYHLFNSLSSREKQIIRLIGSGESSTRIADSLFLSIHTVNNHRKNILHKLNVSSMTQLMKFADAFGII